MSQFKGTCCKNKGPCECLLKYFFEQYGIVFLKKPIFFGFAKNLKRLGSLMMAVAKFAAG
jgi:hypothetical protein